MKRFVIYPLLGVAAYILIVNLTAEPRGVRTSEQSMMIADGGFVVEAIFTTGETIGGYQPVGVMDGMGAIGVDDDTIRVFVNHELSKRKGKSFALENGVSLTGARISYFDLDTDSLNVVAAGKAIHAIYDRAGNQVVDAIQLDTPEGLDRFCSAQLVPAHMFGRGRGIVDDLFMTGEEIPSTKGHPYGGGIWALDVSNGDLWALPALGRGAWENVTQVDTGTTTHVAFLLGDDTADAPLYLYIGMKDQSADADLLSRNGLKGGDLFVWKANNGAINPQGFNGTGAVSAGEFLPVTGFEPTLAGREGYDRLGYVNDTGLRAEADALGAFSFSRPEDLATNPEDGSEVVFASTGRAKLYDGADKIGAIYKINMDLSELDAPSAVLTILYDGDDDPAQRLRSPDNLDWAHDGMIYVQEDRAHKPAFEAAAPNSREASIVQIDPASGTLRFVTEMNRGAVPTGQSDAAPEERGVWESSGIIDLSELLGRDAPLLLATVQAHSVRDGIIAEQGLVQGGQLILIRPNGD